MARTLTEIYTVAKQCRDKYLELTEFQNDSKMSILDAFTWVTSSCIWAFENILDVFKVDLAKNLQNRVNGTPAYFANALLKYQSGDDLVISEDGASFSYATIDESKRIISKVSYSEVVEDGYHDKLAIYKIATGEPGAYARIEEDELLAIRAYLGKILFAGQHAMVVSRNGDVLIPRVTVYHDGAISEDELLSIVSSAEKRSEHPLGKAIVASAEAKGAKIAEPTLFRMNAGKGVYAEFEGHKLFCGSEKFIEENGIGIRDEVKNALTRLRNEGKASVIVADGGKCIGIIALSDVIRSEAEKMVSDLKAMNTRAVLLTGDNAKTAEYFARQVGISEVNAELLPEEKVNAIEKLQRENHKVCMIGDGVNDAPALKRADVSVAMGNMGSDIAIGAADVALISDDISKIPYLKWLSNEAVKTIKISITLSMTINFIAIVLSLMEVLTPTTGALVHNAGSCFVVLIAALLYDKKYKE